MTISQAISQVKLDNKLLNSDSRISDRYIYNKLVSSRDYFLSLKSNTSSLIVNDYLFKPLSNVELIEVDSVKTCGIQTNCIIKRSKDKLPSLLITGDFQAIKQVISVDGFINVTPIDKSSWARKQKISYNKYNKTIYYWIEDQYIYIPNVTWEVIEIIGAWENPMEIDNLNKCCGEQDDCYAMYDQEFVCPRGILEAVITKTSTMLSNQYLRIPEDLNINKNPNDSGK